MRTIRLLAIASILLALAPTVGASHTGPVCTHEPIEAAAEGASEIADKNPRGGVSIVAGTTVACATLPVRWVCATICPAISLS